MGIYIKYVTQHSNTNSPLFMENQTIECAPVEIIEHIMSYCFVKELDVCKKVSKTWLRHAQNTPFDFDEFVVNNRAQFNEVVGVYKIKYLKIYIPVDCEMEKLFRFYESIEMHNGFQIPRTAPIGENRRSYHCPATQLTTANYTTTKNPYHYNNKFELLVCVNFFDAPLRGSLGDTPLPGLPVDPKGPR